MKTDKEVEDYISGSHYLKSSLASVMTLSDALSLSPNKKLIKTLQESCRQLDFRIELYSNFLLRNQKIGKPKLEFFQLTDILIESGLETFFKGDAEILSDREIVKLVVRYSALLAKQNSSNGKIAVSLKKESKTWTLELNTKISTSKTKDFKTDQEFEVEMLSEVVKSFAKGLKGSFKENLTAQTYNSKLSLPERFSL